MEVEIRPREGEQVLHALEGLVLAAQLEDDLLLLAAVQLRGLHGGHEVQRLLDARLQLLEGLLGVLVLRDLHAREARDRALGRVAGDLHLAREREHVRVEPPAGQHQRVDLAGLAVRLRLGEDRGEVLQHAGEARRARLRHRNRHRGSLSCFLRSYTLTRGGSEIMATAKPRAWDDTRYIPGVALEFFKAAGKPEKAAAGQTFFTENEKARPYLFMRDKMFLLLEGEVELLAKKKVIGAVKKGQIFGEMASVTHAPRSATAVAKTPCRVIALDDKQF